MTDLAVLYEHPLWFAPLFAALEKRGIDVAKCSPDGDWNPADPMPPARVVFNRIAMSSFLRSDEHPIFHAMALLDHWRRSGARVINGADVLAIDASKARQLSLIASLGLAIPDTRVVHRAADVVEAARTLPFPLVVKANIGGSGAGIVKFESLDELRAAVADGSLPISVDGVLLVQDYVPARDGIITRIETLDRRLLYAIEVAGGGAFDLCPADACVVPGLGIRMTAVDPTSELSTAAERIADAVDLDVGGVEVMIDDRDGVPRFYDINALSNFVARPLDVLGWDPHERLVDYLVEQIEKAR
ncbi:alpha-L-glutamate ligase [Sphingomonas sp. Leaf339]|uniref:ATP-grasp domain-containing protein n=1 Tax=Sphingomonas sp. Leaf339 TaxID=1736343 RepID=UPI0006F8E866|nr:alpha-L-glutamate ligase [Sphingomonas sp. Leaf339]KQU62546.1 alpha-L-glutamate ligase [Sphingomonas sp. Leaf339]